MSVERDAATAYSVASSDIDEGATYGKLEKRGLDCLDSRQMSRPIPIHQRHTYRVLVVVQGCSSSRPHTCSAAAHQQPVETPSASMRSRPARGQSIPDTFLKIGPYTYLLRNSIVTAIGPCGSQPQNKLNNTSKVNICCACLVTGVGTKLNYLNISGRP